MTKVEELIRVVREQIAYSTEDNSREPLEELIQAVRDEERSKTCPVCAGLPPVESISELIWKCDKCGSELLSIFYQRLSPVLFPFPLRDLPAGGEVPKEEVPDAKA